MSRRSTFRPQIENLEAREVLSVTIGTVDDGHTLQITGDDYANTVIITQDDNANTLTVVSGSQTRVFESDEITKVVVDLKQGNDRFYYRLGGGSDFEHAKNITLLNRAGTGGKDESYFNFAQDGQGGSAQIKAALAVEVNGGGFGDDYVSVDLGRVDNADVLIKTNLGFGDDTFLGVLHGDLTGDADVRFELLGAFDTDTYVIDADNDVDISRNASLDVWVRGGFGNDQIGVWYDGEMDGQLNVGLNGSSGYDEIEAVLNFDDDSEGTLDANVFGGGDHDTLTLKVTGDVSELDILSALIDGGDGRDKAIKTTNVTAKNCEPY